MVETDSNDRAAGFDNEFITEIKDDLELLEPDLLAMETEGGNVGDDLINHAFRAIHSIKGGAGFCGLNDLGALSHSMENVLMRIRDGRLELSSEIVDGLLAGLDKMKLMVESLDSGSIPSYDLEKKALEAILLPDADQDGHKADRIEETEAHDGPSQEHSKEHAEIKVAESPDSNVYCSTPGGSVFKGRSFQIREFDFEKAVKEGKSIYAVHFDSKRDLVENGRTTADIFSDAENAGDLLFTDLDRSVKQSDIKIRAAGFSIVIATILDTDFLAEVFEIPADNVVGLDPDRHDSQVQLTRTPESQEVETHGPLTAQVIKTPERQPEARPAEKNRIVKGNKRPVETIRVNVDLITRLMNLAGELVLSRNQLRPLVEEYALEDAAVNSVMQNLNSVTTEIQEDIMQIRMQPVGNLLKRFKRIVRDMARALSKKVDFLIEGADVELDKTVLEGLANPFTHLMRNCVDHGIEPPDVRRKAGKPEIGMIVVKAFHQGGNVHISIQDNGKGIDPGTIASMAVEKGIITNTQAEVMSDNEKIKLIFQPGFSTSDEVTDISGRGVGMDVVRTNIEKLRGSIDIDSCPGEGTTVHIIIPLTLAIISALIVGTGKYRFAIPQVNLSEVVYLNPGDLHGRVENIGRSAVMRFRGKLLPVVRLRTILNMDIRYSDEKTGQVFLERRNTIADRRAEKEGSSNADKRQRKDDRRENVWDAVYVVVLKVGHNRFGLCVEELFDNEEIVVKPLSDYIKDCRCFCGATILGDGSVIMILDAPGIAGYSGLRFEVLNAEQERRRIRELESRDIGAEARNVIIFSSAEEEYFAIDLDGVARLEAINSNDIHAIGSQKFMEYNQVSIPLFQLDDFIPVTPFDFNKKEMHVIIPKGLPSTSGIIVDKIIDTMEIFQVLDKDGTIPEGIEGKAFVEGRLVQFLNIRMISGLMEKQLIVKA